MTTFESTVKTAPHAAATIFAFVSDFTQFEHLIPKDKVKNWESTQESCRFTVDPIGELGLKIIEKEPFTTVKFTAEGKTPFNFFLWIQLKEENEQLTHIKVTIKADMNPMIKMVASGPVKKFIDTLAEGISNYNY